MGYESKLELTAIMFAALLDISVTLGPRTLRPDYIPWVYSVALARYRRMSPNFVELNLFILFRVLRDFSHLQSAQTGSGVQ
jgi:hypothetical protein